MSAADTRSSSRRAGASPAEVGGAATRARQAAARAGDFDNAVAANALHRLAARGRGVPSWPYTSATLPLIDLRQDGHAG